MDKYIEEFIKENKITKEYFEKNVSKFSRVSKSRELCLNCEGLYACRQKSIGERLCLIKDDILMEGIEYCDYLKNKRKIENLKEAYVYTDIPDQYYSLNLSNIPLEDINIKKYAANCLNILQKQRIQGFYIYGDMGVGKTYMLMALANSLVLNNEKVAFVKMTTFINDLRNSITINDGSYDNIISKLKRVNYLFLDDIGSESVTTFSRDDVLFNILDYRMEHKLCTCFTSNYSKEDLKNHYSIEKNGKASTMQANRLLERIDILSETFVLSGNNKRR